MPTDYLIISVIKTDGLVHPYVKSLSIYNYMYDKFMTIILQLYICTAWSYDVTMRKKYLQI